MIELKIHVVVIVKLLLIWLLASPPVEEGFVKIDKPIREDPNDSRPLGGAKKFVIPEFADGE